MNMLSCVVLDDEGGLDLVEAVVGGATRTPPPVLLVE